jgi:hypothetical protein
MNDSPARLISIATLVCTILMLGPQLANAQDVPPNKDATSVPLPGSGHDYIEMLNETVNPANGSVSVRIKVPLPPARGVQVPFSFDYDSNTANIFRTQALPKQQQAPGSDTLIGNEGFLNSRGWTYGVPLLSSIVSTRYGQDEFGNTFSCNVLANFNFQEPVGVPHPLDLLLYPLDYCPTLYPLQNSGTSSDGIYQGMLLVGDNQQPHPYIADRDGTVYEFAPFVSVDQDGAFKHWDAHLCRRSEWQ